MTANPTTGANGEGAGPRRRPPSSPPLASSQLVFVAALVVVGLGAAAGVVGVGMAITALAGCLVFVVVVIGVPVLGTRDLVLTEASRRALRRARPPRPTTWPTPNQPPRRLTRRGAASAAAAAALLAVVLVLALVARDQRGDVVVGDEALIAMEARSAPQDRPLIGKVTSAVLYGNLELPHNPGPMEVWTLWPFVALLGSSRGAWAFAGAVNLGAAGIATWAAYRRGGGRWAVLTIVTCLVMFERTAPGGLTSVLNTRIVALPLFATLVVAAMVLLGDTAMAVPLVVLASFVVQTHIGYAPVAMAATVVALAVATYRVVSARRWDRPAALLAVAAGTGALLWLPPVIDQVTGSGNLGVLARAEVPRAGAERASRVLGGLLDPSTAFAGAGEIRPEHLGWPSALVVALTLLGIGAFLWWSWPRARAAAPLFGVAAGCIAAAALTGWATPPNDTAGEHYYWFRAVAFFTLYVLLLVAVRPSAPDVPPPPGGSPRAGGNRRRALTVLAALLVIAAAAPLARAPERTADDRLAMGAVHELLPAARPIAEGAAPTALAHRGYWPAISTADGLLAELRDRGLAVVQVDGPSQLADHRVLVVTQGPTRSGAPIARWADEGGQPNRQQTPVQDTTLPEDLVAWVRAHGPLRLAGPGLRNLAPVLDGTQDALCIARFEEDPSTLLDLDPAVVADLYVQRQVDAPELPVELATRLFDWSQDRSIELREAPVRYATDDDPALLLSRTAC
ncbi:MAG: hypothetical protein JNK12_01530 [Acidimicrobiales bacterium]|nr:hypothetical protein [Acidimicrobiales bacterium]